MKKLSKEAQEARKPRPPEELVGALHDKVHSDLPSGKLIRSQPISIKYKTPKETMTVNEIKGHLIQLIAQHKNILSDDKKLAIKEAMQALDLLEQIAPVFTEAIKDIVKH